MLAVLLTPDSCLCRDCGVFGPAYTEYLSYGLLVQNDLLYVELLYNKYTILLWNWGVVKAQKSYVSDSDDPP